jgi:hypothetical protein
MAIDLQGKQTLDKENFTGAFTYNWTPRKNNSAL